MSKSTSYKPNTFLSKYIDRFYTFESSQSDYFELPAVLPGNGIELLFYLDAPLSIKLKSYQKHIRSAQEKCFILML
ncbi:MAG: hypothetical protein ACJA1H_000845 [Glaciecola sp.]|jgi:hypothetical protein